MPNTREKLIELLSQVQYLGGLEEKIADHLIANGVTVDKDNNVPSKWIPVTERLPEKTGRYLTASIRADDERCAFDLWFDCGEWYLDENDDLFIYKVTHWMPLPDPPKGE